MKTVIDSETRRCLLSPMMCNKQVYISTIVIVLAIGIFTRCRQSEPKTEKIAPQQQTEIKKSEDSIVADTNTKDKTGKDSENTNANLQSWLQNLQQKGLILTSIQIDSLIENPQSLLSIRKQMILKYEQLLSEISKKKHGLAIAFQNGNERFKDSLLIEAEVTLCAIVERLLVPLWIGGTWDFYGVPGKTPDLEKPVACGHFIQKILMDAGFNIKKNKETWLAYLDPQSLVKTFASGKQISYSDWSDLLKILIEDGPGLYIVGLECGWGHVLLGRYYGKEDFLLMHAGPHPVGASVNYNDGKSYITDFCGDKICVVRIGKLLTKKWLLNEPIVPYVRKK